MTAIWIPNKEDWVVFCSNYNCRKCVFLNLEINYNNVASSYKPTINLCLQKHG